MTMNLWIRIEAYLRKKNFRRLSGNYRQMEGKPILNQALLINGKGKVSMGERVQLGYELSPQFWTSYAYFDLRGDEARIILGDGVILNNNVSLTADGATIQIGKNTVAGINLNIQTSDGHALDPEIRTNGVFPRLSVVIGDNVFIGDNVIILKGVNIGDNSVIGAGSVVTGDIPDNVLAAGNPCRTIRLLN